MCNFVCDQYADLRTSGALSMMSKTGMVMSVSNAGKEYMRKVLVMPKLYVKSTVE